MEETEISRWLSSISCGLDFTHVSKDFEERGFTTKQSLKYIESSDLDVFFPSPRKLSYAQKKILLKEISQLSTNVALPVPEASADYQTIQTSVPSTPTQPQVSVSNFSKSDGFLAQKEKNYSDDVHFIQAQIASAKQRYTKLQEEANMHDLVAPGRRSKTCSNCHMTGHHKGNCKSASCPGIERCHLRGKHPETKSEMSELQDLIKNLEKKSQKSTNDLVSFKAAREKASNSFFAIMRNRLKCQNRMKYVGTDRIILDRDLMTLKKALGNKVPLNESEDWRLPFIIEEFNRRNVAPFQVGFGCDPSSISSVSFSTGFK